MDLNFEKTCRTCLSKTEKLIAIDENEIQKKLEECCNLQIEMRDDLPKNICMMCANDIEKVFSFRTKCLQSDIHLRNLVNERTGYKLETVEVPEIGFIEAFDQFNCDICHQKFVSKRKLEQHFIDSSTCKLYCIACNKFFDTMGKFNRHCSQFHNDTEFSCHLCDKKYKKNDRLQQHLQTHTKETRLSCYLCNKRFVKKDQLSRHLKEHFIETIDNGSSSNINIDDLLENHPSLVKPNALGMFQCQICKLMLKTRKNLMRHHQTHLGIKYKCKFCDKSYNRKYRVTTHMKEIHGVNTQDDPELIRKAPENNEKPTCEQCGKCFMNKYKLRDHIQCKHSDTRPFLCGQCGQSFKTKSTFEYHETRFHIQIKPFKCDMCEKAYYTKKELNFHIRSHTGEKPFICADCGSSYVHKDSLVTHLRVHTGERPYKCDFCDKDFIKSERLKIHRRIHTGERPYACSFCDQRFTQKYDMIKHEKRHPQYQTVFDAESHDNNL